MTPDPTPAPAADLAKVRTSEKTRAWLSDLRQHPGNPRTISPARLAQLQRTLEAEPDLLEARPLIALPDGTVVAGNQRLAAAVGLGWESIPVVYADLSPEEATRWMLLDNRGFGEDDRDAVAALLGELEAADSDLELTGYASTDIAAMLRELHRPIVDPDAAPPTPVEPSSRVGQVYELGPHRLMCGDATEQAHVDALVATRRVTGAGIAAVVTDPPYGVDIQERDLVQAEVSGRRKDGKGVRNDDLTGESLAEFLQSAFATTQTATDPGAVWYVFAPSGVDYRHPLNALANLGVARHGLVWVKDRFVMGRADYHYRHENVIYGWTPGGPHRKLARRDLDSVLEYVRPGASPEHPTMKPVAMLADMIDRSTVPDDGVLDPFAGSGSTLIACERLGRRCFAMEIDPAYCDVIRQRYADYVGDQKWAP